METILDSQILERIRTAIIVAMGHISLSLNTHYKLSQVKTYTAEFRIEFLQQGLSHAKIRNTLKNKFDYMPTLKPPGSASAFISVDCKKEYDYLVDRLAVKQ